MYKITLSIDNIDFKKLSQKINESQTKNSGGGNDGDDKLPEALEIVSPFVKETMGTVPPGAVVRLFNLFGKDKLLKLASDYGIEISDFTAEVQ